MSYGCQPSAIAAVICAGKSSRHWGMPPPGCACDALTPASLGPTGGPDRPWRPQRAPLQESPRGFCRTRLVRGRGRPTRRTSDSPTTVLGQPASCRTTSRPSELSGVGGREGKVGPKTHPLAPIVPEAHWRAQSTSTLRVAGQRQVRRPPAVLRDAPRMASGHMPRHSRLVLPQLEVEPMLAACVVTKRYAVTSVPGAMNMLIRAIAESCVI
jgi:hypothetical protein